MTREDFIKIIDSKVKLIRNEKNYTQDKMAYILGVSKKTLVQIEKGRGTLGWTTAVAVSTLFRDSEILQLAFGGETQDIILSLAFDSYEGTYDKTMGGRIWWEDIEFKGIYKIQQNIISKHYRILDDKDRRICSSFDFHYIHKRLKELNT
ncbi:helix-turn-helix domain-containing protein [Clostridium sp. CX1]|uniref:helix-turn-helix transcriptional regulator n=1 Tax=Clostridium sp. CX1 TaxID=2978346 RepID=UPI0021C1B752|nr:helix-turn-helix domain-containing protein [Clostridium sp. CX1]MCT8978460.1 helix-turn-helix domain-containing protein [Clostridium sp. CX1]